MILQPTSENIRQAALAIQQGKVVAFPTETVYGLGANAFSEEAVHKVFSVKKRPSFNPLIVHLASADLLPTVATVPNEPLVRDRVRKLSSLWPGPLSLILPKQPRICAAVTANLNTVAVRVPDHPVALQLLAAAELPIAAPSANPSSSLSPTNAADVQDALGSNVDIILDGGTCRVGVESTIVNVLEGKVRILRPGGISRERLAEVLGEEVLAPPERKPSRNASAPPLAPGMLDLHYAPHTPLAFRADVAREKWPAKVGLLSFREPSAPDLTDEFAAVYVLSREGDLDEVAANLFAALRQLDKQGLELILVDSCPEDGIGLAIMDRLRRARHS